MRRTMAAAVALAVSAGMLTPASAALALDSPGPSVTAQATPAPTPAEAAKPARATESPKPPAAAPASPESVAAPTIDLVPGQNNTVTITMKNGVGLTARLMGSKDGKDTVLWTAP